MIFTEIHEKIWIDTEALLAYRCEDLDNKVQGVWIYDTSSRDPLVKVYCHANEGELTSSSDLVAYQKIYNMATRILCWPTLSLPSN